MKKTVLGLLVLATGVFIGCQDNASDLPNNQESKIDMSDFYVHTDEFESKSDKNGDKVCYSMKVLNEQLSKDKNLYKKCMTLSMLQENLLLLKNQVVVEVENQEMVVEMMEEEIL
jgi:hypothetical protein